MFKSIYFFRMAFRSVFSEAMKQMYGIKHNLSSLPIMPSKEGTWSVMHSWTLPTKSFLEFVMFSRFRLLNPVSDKIPNITFNGTISFIKLLFCQSIESLWMRSMHDSTRITKRLGSVISAYPRYFSFNLHFLSISASLTNLAMFLSSR